MYLFNCVKGLILVSLESTHPKTAKSTSKNFKKIVFCFKLISTRFLLALNFRSFLLIGKNEIKYAKIG